MEDKRKRYKIKCPHCGTAQYACKSILHELGIGNGGVGVCWKCKGLMRIVFDSDREEMRAEK